MKESISTDLEKIFKQHYDQWCLLCFTYLQDRIEAEEVVQDIFVSILLSNKGKEILDLRAYICSAIRHKCLIIKKRKRKFARLSDNDIIIQSTEQTLIQNETVLQILAIIESLPNSTKTVFKLCTFERQKYKYVAETMGISVNTVKYHMKKAYTNLRNNMEKISSSLVTVILCLFY